MQEFYRQRDEEKWLSELKDEEAKKILGEMDDKLTELQRVLQKIEDFVRSFDASTTQNLGLLVDMRKSVDAVLALTLHCDEVNIFLVPRPGSLVIFAYYYTSEGWGGFCVCRRFPGKEVFLSTS